jgi:two-component system, chemotaxis family, protein-glutamate methylesterase/glutaminase
LAIVVKKNLCDLVALCENESTDNMKKIKYKAIVIGVSAGGLKTLPKVIKGLDSGFPLPIIMVQHTVPENDFVSYIDYLRKTCTINIKVADEKEKILPGTLYIAPANYHLLIETDFTFSLNIDEKVKFSRPSIDVLFETAAYAYQDKLIAVILTGASDDGTDGMKTVKKYNGLTIAQNPEEAYAKAMPESAIKQKVVYKILYTSEINKLLKCMI